MTQPFPGFLSLLSTIDPSVTISPMIVLILAGVIASAGAVLALLFDYHWKTYGVNKVEVLRVRFWYYTGSAVFGGGMLLSALLFALNV